MRLGKVLCKWRLLNDLTLRDFAPQLGVSAPTLMRIENGYEMDVSTFKKILDWLMEDEGNRKHVGRRAVVFTKEGKGDA